MAEENSFLPQNFSQYEINAMKLVYQTILDNKICCEFVDYVTKIIGKNPQLSGEESNQADDVKKRKVASFVFALFSIAEEMRTEQKQKLTTNNMTIDDPEPGFVKLYNLELVTQAKKMKRKIKSDLDAKSFIIAFLTLLTQKDISLLYILPIIPDNVKEELPFSLVKKSENEALIFSSLRQVARTESKFRELNEEAQKFFEIENKERLLLDKILRWLSYFFLVVSNIAIVGTIVFFLLNPYLLTNPTTIEICGAVAAFLIFCLSIAINKISKKQCVPEYKKISNSTIEISFDVTTTTLDNFESIENHDRLFEFMLNRTPVRLFRIFSETNLNTSQFSHFTDLALSIDFSRPYDISVVTSTISNYCQKNQLDPKSKSKLATLLSHYESENPSEEDEKRKLIRKLMDEWKIKEYLSNVGRRNRILNCVLQTFGYMTTIIALIASLLTIIKACLGYYTPDSLKIIAAIFTVMKLFDIYFWRNGALKDFNLNEPSTDYELIKNTNRDRSKTPDDYQTIES